MIGLDPNTGDLRTWTFEADGGYGEGTCTRDGAKWIFATKPTLTDGRAMTATNILTPHQQRHVHLATGESRRSTTNRSATCRRSRSAAKARRPAAKSIGPPDRGAIMTTGHVDRSGRSYRLRLVLRTEAQSQRAGAAGRPRAAAAAGSAAGPVVETVACLSGGYRPKRWIRRMPGGGYSAPRPSIAPSQPRPVSAGPAAGWRPQAPAAAGAAAAGRVSPGRRLRPTGQLPAAAAGRPTPATGKAGSGPGGGSSQTSGPKSGSITTKGGSTIDYKGAGRRRDDGRRCERREVRRRRAGHDAGRQGGQPGRHRRGRRRAGRQRRGREVEHHPGDRPGRHGHRRRPQSGVAVGPGGAVAGKSGVAVGPGGRPPARPPPRSGQMVPSPVEAGVATGPGGAVAGKSGAAVGPGRGRRRQGQRGGRSRRGRCRQVGAAVGPGGAVAGRTRVAATPHGTYYRSAGAITGQGVYVRQGFSITTASGPGGTPGTPVRGSRPDWPPGLPGPRRAGAASPVRAATRPSRPTTTTAARPWPRGARSYVNGDAVGTTEQYAEQAEAIADTGQQAKPPEDEKWQSLGVFAMVQGEETTCVQPLPTRHQQGRGHPGQLLQHADRLGGGGGRVGGPEDAARRLDCGRPQGAGIRGWYRQPDEGRDHHARPLQQGQDPADDAGADRGSRGRAARPSP